MENCSGKQTLSFYHRFAGSLSFGELGIYVRIYHIHSLFCAIFHTRKVMLAWSIRMWTNNSLLSLHMQSNLLLTPSLPLFNLSRTLVLLVFIVSLCLWFKISKLLSWTNVFIFPATAFLANYKSPRRECWKVLQALLLFRFVCHC